MAKSMNELLNDANAQLRHLEMGRFHERSSIVAMAILLVHGAFQKNGFTIDQVNGSSVKRCDLVPVSDVVAALRQLSFHGPCSQQEIHDQLEDLTAENRLKAAVIVKQNTKLKRMNAAQQALEEDFEAIQSALNDAAGYKVPPDSVVKELQLAMNMMHIHLAGLKHLLRAVPKHGSIAVHRPAQGPFAFDMQGNLAQEAS